MAPIHTPVVKPAARRGTTQQRVGVPVSSHMCKANMHRSTQQEQLMRAVVHACVSGGGRRGVHTSTHTTARHTGRESAPATRAQGARFSPSGQAWQGGVSIVALPPFEKVPAGQAGQVGPPP